MRRAFTFIFFLVAALAVKAQTLDTIVQWTFPDSSHLVAPYPDGGLPVNLNSPITVQGGVDTIVYNYTGITTWCARAYNWTNGSGTKYWQIMISTQGYDSLRLSCWQRSSSAAPRDFKTQYKVNSGGVWTDIPNATITVTTSFTNTLNNVLLPAACDQQDSLYIRWIMTSNIAADGSSPTVLGPTRMDDLFVTGLPTFTGITSQTGKNKMTISQDKEGEMDVRLSCRAKELMLYDMRGDMIYSSNTASEYFSLNTAGFPGGLYLVDVIFSDGTTLTGKIILK